jgi:cell division protein FtsI (penicillin-binding protein 3)
MADADLTFSDGEIVEAAELEGGDAPVEVGMRMPDFTGMSFRQVLRTMEETGINIKLNGSGRVIEQNPPPGHPIRFGNEVWVRFAAPT